MKNTWLLFSVLLLAVCFCSCSLEKRVYRNGFYVERPHKTSRLDVAQTKIVAEREKSLTVISVHPDPRVLQSTEKEPAIYPRTSSAQLVLVKSTKKIKPPVKEIVKSIVKPADEKPAAETKDKPNKLLLGLFLAVVILPVCILFILPIPGIAFGFLIAPLILSAFLYFLALIIRGSIKKNYPDATEGKHRLSDAYAKFKKPLFTYVISTLLILLAVLLIVGNPVTTTTGIFAIILLSLALALGFSSLGALIVQSIVYLAKRKKG